MKLKTLLPTLTLLLILTVFIMVPMVQSSPETYGPRLDELVGRFIESPAAQEWSLYLGEVDYWPDIRDPQIIRNLEDDGFNVVITPEAFLVYRIDFNVRDQWGNGTHVWCDGGGWTLLPRGPLPRDASYYSYLGTIGGGGNTGGGDGYAPLDDQAFRHAIAHLIPKEEIVATVYGGVSAAAINSTVPPAQAEWHNPNVDGHPYSRSEAISILEAAGFVFDPDAPNPAPKHSPSDPDGNWIDPYTGEPMNYIQFAGVTEAIAPDSYGRDDMCGREFRAIGLPIEHVEVDYGYLTDTMMDYYQFDMYALGWKVGRFPDHLYGFFHSSNDFAPEGYNIPGVEDPELDVLLDIIQHETDLAIVKTACFDAQDRLAELCVSIPTVTRPLTVASVQAGDASGSTDTLMGIVNSHGYGSTNDWTFYGFGWESGPGGLVRYIVPSEPTNYHPGYASTTDEWMVLSRIFDPLIQVNPYLHEDIPWLATDWSVEPWPEAEGPGMNTTFWLRNDIYWHDGVHFNATQAKWSLEFARDQQIARALPMWQHLVDIEVHDAYTFSVYHAAPSLWTFYHLAGPDLWLINDAACWATMFPQHIYEGTDRYFRPEETVNPVNSELTCLIGTGPYVYREGDLWLGGYAHLTAYRPGPSPVATSWFKSVEEINALLTEMFHWIGDVNRDGIINIIDLAMIGVLYGYTSEDPEYDVERDLTNGLGETISDGDIDIYDIVWAGAHYGEQRTYPDGGWGGAGGASSQSNGGFGGSSSQFMIGESQQATEPTMHVDPPETLNYTLKTNDAFSVDINITNVADLLGCDFRLTFNSTILSVVSVTPGDFFGANPQIWHENINNAGGFVRFALTPEPGDKIGKSGSGRLATINFMVQGYGNSSLEQKGFTKLANSKGIKVAHLTLDGYFDNRNPADVNEDGLVDIYDFSIGGLAYGSVIGEPEYNPKADITKDGLVDMRDMAIIGWNYGWNWTKGS